MISTTSPGRMHNNYIQVRMYLDEVHGISPENDDNDKKYYSSPTATRGPKHYRPA